MKRLILFLCIMISLQVSQIFAQEVAPKEIEKMTDALKEGKNTLEEQQQYLAKHIEKQNEIIRQATGNRKEVELNTLTVLQALNDRATIGIKSLSDYLNQVAEKKVTRETQDAIESSIRDAEKSIRMINYQLGAEYVQYIPLKYDLIRYRPEESDFPGLWDTFKLNIQSIFARTAATLANFFGNKEAVAAAHKDLIDIYDQLKDYSSKAQSARELVKLYKDLGDFGNAMATQITFLDAQVDQAANADIGQAKLLSELMANLFFFRGLMSADVLLIESEAQANPLTPEDRNTILRDTLTIETKINDFLSELGYKIDKMSAYQLLGLKPDATVDNLKGSYKKLVELYTPQPGDTPEIEQKLKEKLGELNNAFKELFGPDMDKPDLSIREAYDKLPIVQKGFEIKEMTQEERTAFAQQKASEKSKEQAKQTDILGG